MSYPFLKGHGTENDFILLPDHDGTTHGDLPRERVAALCDRRAGIGGDGVLRVIRTAAYDASWAGAPDPALTEQGAEWFMDYRNGDGSLSEMCGNGVRVFARHLVDAGLVDAAVAAGDGIPIATRAGLKVVRVDGESITADMGEPRLLGTSVVAVDDHTWPARHVDMGNPHAVAFVDDLAEAGPLLEPPVHDEEVYPEGVNVEFVVRRGARHVAMRVHERGSGETRSCGTGACAVMVATAEADGVDPEAHDDVEYVVDVPGGRLTLTWTAAGRVLLTGPGVVVAEGATDL